MYCSICGANDQSANAFCKRCGEWLPDIKAASRVAFGGKTPQQNIFTNLFMSALSSIAALVAAIALYATYLGSGDAKWSVYLAAAVCLCIAGWQASSFAVALKLRRRWKNMRDGRDSTIALNEMKTEHALRTGDATAFINVPAVTEDTTELLQPHRSQTERKRG